MEKADLYSRLVDLERAIHAKNQEAQQAMADMNVLIGQKVEVQHWLSTFGPGLHLAGEETDETLAELERTKSNENEANEVSEESLAATA